MIKHNINLVKQYFKNARVTSIFLAVIWVMFLVECIMTWMTAWSTDFGLKKIYPDVLLRLGANVPLLVLLREYYRTFTAILLHAGILHIFMNTMSLIGFCALLEAAFTWKHFLLVYVVGGIQGTYQRT